MKSHRDLLMLTLFSVILTGSATLTHADHRADGPIIPSDAVAFVHMDVTKLSQSPNLAFASRMMQRVAPEASSFSMQRLGVDVTKLTDATFVVRTFSPVDQHSNAGVLAISFASAFEQQTLVSQLKREMHLKAYKDQTFGNDELALHVASEHTLVAGSPNDVAWWRESRRTPGDQQLPMLFDESKDQSQLLLGMNVEQIEAPPMVFAFVPATLLNQAEVVACGFSFNENVTIAAQWRYNNQETADTAVNDLQTLVSQVKSMLAPQEHARTAALNDASTSTAEGFKALAELALIRQGQAYLDSFSAERRATTAHAVLSVDNEIPTAMMVCLTSISAIGTQANQQFEAIAAELE